MAARQWARLRQVGFAALDHAAAVRTATDLLALALGPGFGDPLLATLGLADFTAPAASVYFHQGTLIPAAGPPAP